MQQLQLVVVTGKSYNEYHNVRTLPSAFLYGPNPPIKLLLMFTFILCSLQVDVLPLLNPKWYIQESSTHF